MTSNKKTSKQKEQIEHTIFDLEHEIEKEITFSDENLPEKIQKLRRYAFYAHTILETTLSFTIIKTLLERGNPFPSFSQEMFLSWSDYMGYVHEIFDPMRYIQKLNALKKLRAFDSKWINKLERLNTLRNILAHTKNNKYKKILSDKNNLTALKLIKDCLDISKELHKRFDTMLPDHGDIEKIYKEEWKKYLK